MLTIFAIPKPFRGHIEVIQRNAIGSWTRLSPRPEILLFGDEDGTARTAAEFGVQHSGEVARNEFGAPLLGDLFTRAESVAATPILAYVNADIMLTDDFISAIERVHAAQKNFLMVGQRSDLDLDVPWDFDAPDWRTNLAERVRRAGTLRPPTFVDYFAFTRGFAEGLLPLAIGRCAWDNYLVWRGRERGPVVDATRVVTAVHQNHDYSHHPLGQKGAMGGVETRRNRRMIGGWWHLYTIEDATHVLTPAGLDRSHRHPWLMAKRLWSHPLTVFTWPWHMERRVPRT